MKKMAGVLKKESSKVDLPDAGVYRENRGVVPASSKSPPRRAETAVEAAQRQRDMQAQAYNLAAVRIQAFFRGWWVRDYVAVDNFCAKMIQKAFRGFRCRSNYSFDLFRIVLVQSIARKSFARKESLIRLSSVVAIQAAFRAFLVRRSLALMYEQVQADRLMAESSLYNEAATKIQSQWRSYACEMKYLRSYDDIVMVQTLVRGMITRRLLQAWLKAHNIHLKSSHLQTHDEASKRTNNRTLAPRSHGVHTKRAQQHVARTAQQRIEAKDQTSIMGNGRVLMRYSEAGEPYHEIKTQGIGTQGQNVRSAGHKREMLSYSASSEEEKSSKDIAPQSTIIEKEVEMRRKELAAIATRLEEEMRENEREMRRNDLAAIAKRQEEEKRNKSLVFMTAARDKQQRKNDRTAPQSLHDEQLTKGIAAFAAQQEPKRRKEKRINDLAQLFARQEERNHSAPIHTVLQQDAPPPKYSPSVEGTKRQLATVSKEESVVSYDRSEQLRKDRIAYHVDSEAVSKKAERVPQALGIESQGEQESFEEASQADLKDSFESNVNPDGAFEHLPPVQKEKSGMCPPSTVSETPRARKSGMWPPSAASNILPTRTVTSASKERSETGSQSAASIRSPDRHAPAVAREKDASEITPERDGSPIQTDGVGMGKPISASQSSSVQNKTERASNGTASMKCAPILPSKRHNPFQCQRTEEEQSRIDKIHDTFLRVGLMARAANVRVALAPVSKVTALAVQTKAKLSSPSDEVSFDSPRPDQEASASDLIRAWRGRDQTQPKMQGKLF
jgi:hypothetical protein